MRLHKRLANKYKTIQLNQTTINVLSEESIASKKMEAEALVFRANYLLKHIEDLEDHFQKGEENGRDETFVYNEGVYMKRYNKDLNELKKFIEEMEEMQ